jgi:hypothetical protein
VIRLLLIIQVPHASDKRRVAVSFCPIDRFSLCFEGAEHMVHMVFDYIIVDGASLRPTLGTGLNVYVGHDLLSLGSFCWRNENYTKPKPLPDLVLAFRRSLPGRFVPASHKIKPRLGASRGLQKPA